uniref:Putative chaperone protein n=1 Tax=Thauera sp. pCyN2 TaxID=1551544 RepID=A0A096ZNY2_9RHOO|nr:putative chaperone protein [Thauera sp. pCyN2]
MSDTLGSSAGAFIPEEDPYYYASSETLSFLDKIHRISKKHPVNVLVTGKQGCGKSSLVRQYAAAHRLPLATFQIGILSEPGQLFGEYALENGETRYKQFLFPQALQTPNCVIHLEEINRPEHPKALNMLFSILSDDRQVWMDELGLLRVADGVTFFATLNEGDEYVGTELLDPALRDRFYVISMDYLPNEVEIEVLEKKTGITRQQATEVMEVVNKLRGNSDFLIDVSTRKALMIAEMIACGGGFREAIAASLQTDRATLESALMSLHVTLGKVEKGKTEYLLYTGKSRGTASLAKARV